MNDIGGNGMLYRVENETSIFYGQVGQAVEELTYELCLIFDDANEVEWFLHGEVVQVDD
jgi:hypothetical protein